MPFAVGENVGPYRIIEQLGQGGMATVFKAYHAFLDRYVAIKALHPAFNQDPNFEARFQREARVVAKLEHPHIVPVYDYAEHEKRPYLVMKFIEGDTLKARLDTGPLPSEDIVSIVDAVGSALAYAHRQGVLHRDIKPSNVLVAKDGQIYLADFGLARMAQLGESTLSSDTIMGTPQYISPEQAMGIKELDERTDLYSFGVMLYEMIVGKVPFNADTPFSVIHDHIYSPLPLPHTVNPNVPESVERVLLKALAKERDDRYENVAQMVTAFKDAWAEARIPVQGPQDTFINISQPLTRPAKAVPKPEPIKTIVEPEPINMTANVEQTVTGTEPIRNRSTSMWLGVGDGLIIILCIGAFLFARNNRLFARFLASSRTSTNTPEVFSLSTSAPNPPLSTPSTGGQALPADVKEAQRRANENPNDPNAQLDLALAFWNANMPGATYETLSKVVNLAGPENESFYMEAGDTFANMEGWLPAAFMYYQVVQDRSQTSEGVPDHIQDSFREAMYKSADRPEVSIIVPFDKVAEVDTTISFITQARHAFYSGRIKEARNLINELKQYEDTSREGYLLEGEIALVEGNHETARQFLEGLAEDQTSTPEWIRVFASELLERLP
ncbi:MAG TPA: serine/threonine-protein kinase [Anaerolineales bacterium]|nr:serine/threonine-protein kinase [Anaerolineales bacterium]